MTAAASAVGPQASTTLFVRDVRYILRWHAVVAGVALAGTPLVYKLARVVAYRRRAEVVSLARDAVQREELFNGAEADGVLIDPADEGGISVSYGAAAPQRSPREGAAADRPTAVSWTWPMSPTSPPQPSASTFALRVGRRHSWMVSSFAHQVLAAQRAPTTVFVRTCSQAAVCQYVVVVLRSTAASCLVSIASFAVFYAACRSLDLVVPLTTPPATPPAVTAPSLLRALATQPLFTTAAPPSPAVADTYGLFSFGVSAAGVWSRVLPRLGPLQTAWQRLAGCSQPLHAEWRAGSASPHALADTVWAALSPRGYLVVALLSRLPARIIAGARWSLHRATAAAMRRWYATAPAPSSPLTKATTPAVTPPPPSGAAAPAPPSVAGAPRRRRREAEGPQRLRYSPLMRTAAALASDVVFAGVVFVATYWADTSGSDVSGTRWRLVSNTANARYDVYCWVEAVCSLVSIVGV